MALTAAEQAELAQLEAEIGGGLSPSEAQELAQLEAEFGGPQEKIVNEMPKGLQGRFTYKNFAGDQAAGFNYLQKENPDFEFKKDNQGEILARKKGTPDWGRLDPKGFDLQDISDIAYDVPAAVAQGAATAASGVAGAVGSPYALGLGAIPAAMAGSAASGVGLETLRQGIGRMMGIEDNFSGQDIAIAGGTGAVSPLLFGTGAGAKEALKASLKEGTKQGAEEILKSQKGLLGRGYDATMGYVAPKIGSIAGGYDPKVLKKASENLNFIKATEKNPELAVQMIEKNKGQFVDSLNTARKQVGKQLENTATEIDALGGRINTQSVMAPLMDLKKKLSTTGVQNEARKEAVGEIDSIIAKYFTVEQAPAGASSVDLPAVKSIPDSLGTAQVQQLRNELKDYAQTIGLKFSDMGSSKGVSQAKSSGNRDVLNALTATSDVMKKEMDDVVGKLSPELKQKFDNQNAMYSMYKELQDDFYTSTKAEEAFNRFLKRQGVTADAAKKKMSEIAGKNVNDLASEMQAIEMFRNPRWQIPAMGGSNTMRTGGLAAAGAAAGYLQGRESGEGTTLPMMIGGLAGGLGASPAALRMMMTGNQKLRQMPQQLPGYKALPYLMMNTEQGGQ